jgi:hypothetical protein
VKYAIAIGGIVGVYLLAYALLGARFLFPRWKRTAIGAVGLALVVVMWAVHPDISDAPDDGSSLADQWP